MNLKRTVNGLLVRITGYQLSRPIRPTPRGLSKTVSRLEKATNRLLWRAGSGWVAIKP